MKYIKRGFLLLILLGVAATALGLNKQAPGEYCEWTERYGRATTMYGSVTIVHEDGTKTYTQQRCSIQP